MFPKFSKLAKAWHTRKMLDAARQGDGKAVAACLEKGADARANRGEAINGAVASGNLELFEVLTAHDPEVVRDVRLGVLAKAQHQAWQNVGNFKELCDRRAIDLRLDMKALALAREDAEKACKPVERKPPANPFAGT